MKGKTTGALGYFLLIKLSKEVAKAEGNTVNTGISNVTCSARLSENHPSKAFFISLQEQEKGHPARLADLDFVLKNG